MTFIEHLNAYQGTPSVEELNQAIGLLADRAEDAQLTAKVKLFNPKFLQFISDGDISVLAPTGTMDLETYTATKSYVFCNIEHVSGRTVLGRYLSGKHFTGLLPENSELIGQLVLGPCIVIHEQNLIKSWLTISRDDMQMYGGMFNNVASRSKGVKQ